MTSVPNQDVIPILVLGEIRRQQLTSRMTVAVKSWLQTWSGASVPTEVTVDVARIADQAGSVQDGGQVVRGAVGAIEHLSIFAASDLLASVLGLPSRAVASIKADGLIAAATYDEVLVSLGQGLVADLQMGAWQIEVPATRAGVHLPPSYRHGWILSIGWGGRRHNLELLMSATLVSHLAPRTAKPATADLFARRAAIAEESVRLEAVLGAASVSVGDLASLAINDVIVLADEASQPSYLVTERGRRVANVALGRIGSKRAAVIKK